MRVRTSAVPNAEAKGHRRIDIAGGKRESSEARRRNSDHARRARSTTVHCRIMALPAGGRPVIKLWNESRTNRARIADSIAVGIRSRRHLVVVSLLTTKSGKHAKAAAHDPGDIG